MSYSGMGAAFTNVGMKTSLPQGTSSAPRVDVGVDMSIARAFRNLFANVAQSSDPSMRARLSLAVYGIDNLRPNEFSRFPVDKVKQALLALDAPTLSFMDRAIDPGSGRTASNPLAAGLNRYTVSKFLADINSGKFSGHAAQPKVSVTTTGMRVVTGLPGALAPKTPPPPPVSTTKTEVECTDGYVRDAQGLCVPGAAPPAVTEQKPAEQPPVVDSSSGSPGTDVNSNQWLIDGGSPPVLPSDIALPESAGTKKIFGISWPWLAGGAAVVATGLYFVTRKRVTPNKKRRRRGKGRS